VQPPGAFYHEASGQFILAFAAVHNAGNPEQKLLQIVKSTYIIDAWLAN